MSRLSVLAHEAGVRIAIEPKPGTLVATIEDITFVAGEVAKGDSIGALLDIGHEFAGRDPAPIVSTLGQRLFHVHLGDSDGDPDADLPPGRLHPLDPFLAALDSIGYDGAMSPDAYGAVVSHSMTGAEALAETVQRVASYNAGR